MQPAPDGMAQLNHPFDVREFDPLQVALGERNRPPDDPACQSRGQRRKRLRS